MMATVREHKKPILGAWHCYILLANVSKSWCLATQPLAALADMQMHAGRVGLQTLCVIVPSLQGQSSHRLAS